MRLALPIGLAPPIAALIKREFVSTLRGLRSFVLMALFVLVCIVVVVWLWPDEERLFMQAAELSRELMMQIAFLLLGACALFVPALGATSIVVEREQQTFDFLRTTLIRPSGIVLAKLLNTVGFFLVLFVAVTPVLSAVFFLFGLDWFEFAQVLGILLATAFSCAMAGILASAWFRKPLIAIGAAYIGVLIAMLGSFILRIPVIMLTLFGLFRLSGLRTIPLAWSPVGALLSLFDQSLLPEQFVLVLMYQAMFCGICFALTLNALGREPAPPMLERMKPIDDPRILHMRRHTWPYYLIDPLARKKPIEDGRNPMLVRELRWGVANRGTLLLRTFFVGFIIWFFTSVPAALDTHVEAVVYWFVFQMVATAALAPAFLANTLTKEYEVGNIDMLRMTLITSRQVILGKVIAGGMVVLPFVLAAIAASLSLVVMHHYEWELLLTGYASLAVCAALSVALGLFASLLTTRSSTALVLAYLLAVAVFAGSFVVRYLFDLEIAFRPPDNALHALCRCLDSPIIAFAVNARTDVNGSVSVSWLGNVFLYGAGCVGLIAYSIRRFERFRRRDA